MRIGSSMHAREKELAGLDSTAASTPTKPMPLTPMSLTTTSKRLCHTAQKIRAVSSGVGLRYRGQRVSQQAALALPQP